LKFAIDNERVVSGATAYSGVPCAVWYGSAVVRKIAASVVEFEGAESSLIIINVLGILSLDRTREE
jgi:hypothetical protein